MRTALPAVAMLVTTIASLSFLLPRYAGKGQWSLVAADVGLIALAAGVVVVTWSKWKGLRTA